MILNINRTPIQITFNKNKKREEKFLHWLKICKEKNSLRQVSNVGGIHTESFPLFMIKDSFKQNIDQYLNSFNKRCNFKWKINACWVNENYYGDFNMPHNHAALNSQFSGIWYLKCPPNSGKLVFLNQPTNVDYSILYDFIDDPLSWVKYFVIPEQYKLILFPSSLVHLVEPNKSNESRISVAFNIGLTK
jgi:uncharacterized protein (TIGR02466 family)